MNDYDLLTHLKTAAAFSLLGLIIFGVAWAIIVKVTPFSIRKELEIDQNTALGVVLGSLILGLAIIIAAAIHG